MPQGESNLIANAYDNVIQANDPLVMTHDAVGTKMRLQLVRSRADLPFPPINNVKVVVYLRR